MSSDPYTTDPQNAPPGNNRQSHRARTVSEGTTSEDDNKPYGHKSREDLENELAAEKEWRRMAEAESRGMRNALPSTEWMQEVIREVAAQAIANMTPPIINMPPPNISIGTINSKRRMPAPTSAEAPVIRKGPIERALMDFFTELESCFDEAGVKTEEEKAGNGTKVPLDCS
ncbi:9884_t:CDS:1, partial [Acaulospora colombiana]